MDLKSVFTVSALLVYSMVSCGRSDTSSGQADPALTGGGQSELATRKEAVVPDGAHNSRNALDWSGSYRGVLPCADCEGIETTVSLQSTGAYTRTIRYVGKSDRAFVEEGVFRWNPEGSSVILQIDDGSEQMYKVGENVLFHLDREGKRITGDLADRYQLLKIDLDR